MTLQLVLGLALCLGIGLSPGLIGGGGSVRLQAAVLFAETGMVSALLGARLTYLVSPQVLLLSFAALMLAAGLRMVRTGRPAGGERRPARPVKVALAGLAVGLLTGFLGVGGGFLIVPALVPSPASKCSRRWARRCS